MKSIHLFILLVLLMFFSCTSMNYYNYNVQHTVDEFDGYTLDRMTGNYIKDSDLLNMQNSVWLNAQRFLYKDGTKEYSLIIEYWDTDWLFIDEGESLVLLIDDVRFGFRGEGSINHRTVDSGMSNAVIKETAWYDVDPAQLRTISTAKNIKMKIVGESEYVVRELSSENINNFKKFVNEFVKD